MPVLGFGAAAALAKLAAGIRNDPYQGFNFLVEIQGLIAGGFTRVSGLSITTEVQTVAEGGVNSHVHRLPKGTSHADLVLEGGVTDFDMMWGWYEDVVSGKFERRNGTIYLLDRASLPAMWWNFTRAFPVKWDGPQFDAERSTVAAQTLTLAHEGLTRPKESLLFSAARGAASAALDIAQR